MKGKHFIETSNKVEIPINRVRINRSQPVVEEWFKVVNCNKKSSSITLAGLPAMIELCQNDPLNLKKNILPKKFYLMSL